MRVCTTDRQTIVFHQAETGEPARGHVDARGLQDRSIDRQRVDQIDRTRAVDRGRRRTARDQVTERSIALAVALVEAELPREARDHVFYFDIVVVAGDREVAQSVERARVDDHTRSPRRCSFFLQVRVAAVEAGNTLDVRLVQRERTVCSDIRRYARSCTTIVAQCAAAGGTDAFAGIGQAAREGLRQTREQLAHVRRTNRLGVGAAETDVFDRRPGAGHVPAERGADGRVVRYTRRCTDFEDFEERGIGKDRNANFAVGFLHVERTAGVGQDVTGVEAGIGQRIIVRERAFLAVFRTDSDADRTCGKLEERARKVGLHDLLGDPGLVGALRLDVVHGILRHAARAEDVGRSTTVCTRFGVDTDRFTSDTVTVFVTDFRTHGECIAEVDHIDLTRRDLVFADIAVVVADVPAELVVEQATFETDHEAIEIARGRAGAAAEFGQATGKADVTQSVAIRIGRGSENFRRNERVGYDRAGTREVVLDVVATIGRIDPVGAARFKRERLDDARRGGLVEGTFSEDTDVV